MKMLAIAAGCAVLSLGSTAVAQGGGGVDYARYDARVAADLPSKLAICDTARFLRTSPDLDANVVYVYHSGQGRYEPLLPPHFVGGAFWYDEDLERTYRRLKSQGQVSSEAVRQARQGVGREMVRAFDRPSGTERRFLDEQSRYCETVEDLGRA